MIKFYSVCFCLFLLVSLPTCAQSKFPGLTVVETSHGLYEVEVLGKQKAANTLTQSMNMLKGEKLLLKTDTVIADIGKTFGVEFTINTGNQTAILPVKIVWEFPKPMKNPNNGKVYKTSELDQAIITNQPMFHSYTLEYDYEFVEGLWSFKVFYNDVEIYKHSFWVMLPL